MSTGTKGKSTKTQGKPRSRRREKPPFGSPAQGQPVERPSTPDQIYPVPGDPERRAVRSGGEPDDE